VLFTRDPLSGAPEPFGDWLPGGQGEDVVAGTHDPLPLSAFHDSLPEAHDTLIEAGKLLERENGDVQDIEFTVERGRLYLLQSRAAKRSPLSAVRTAVELADEGAIDRETALTRITPDQLERVLAPLLADEVTAGAEVIAKGTPACPGVASGRVVAHSDDAELADDDVVLARPTTSPEDVAGMIGARAVVTERGGATSHAAVVTRALGRPSVVGVGENMTAGWTGRQVTVDGSKGVVYAGRLSTSDVPVEDIPGLPSLIEWAREQSPAEVVETGRDDALDLDAAGHTVAPDAAPDVDALAEAMRGASAVRGSVLSTAEGAAAVVRSGVPTVVALPGQHIATLLLRLVQARKA
jgi:pyruvate,orthophosphate dikinase